jgi:hypothetical protein
VREIVSGFLVLYADTKPTGLRISEIGAASDLEILFLAGRPRLNVNALYLQVGQISRTAFNRTYGDIHGAEKVNRVVIQLYKPFAAVFGLADNNHFLFLKLVDTVNAALFDPMCADFLPEARRIAGQCLGQLLLFNEGIDEFTDHRVLTRSDQVQILPFYFIHHVFHLGEAHNAVDDIAADHKGRNIVCEAPVDHEVTRVGKNGRMQACYVSAEIVETVAARFPRTFDVDAMQLFHNVNMIRYLKIGNGRFAETLNLHVLTVVLSDWNGIVNDIRDYHHPFFDLGVELFLQLLQFNKLPGNLGNSLLVVFRFLFPAFGHQISYFLADGIPLASQVVAFELGIPVFFVHFYNFIDKYQLLILELLFDVFLNQLGVRPQ